MKKLKCESCGGILIPDEKGVYATCNFCHTKYKISDDQTIHVSFENNAENLKENYAAAKEIMNDFYKTSTKRSWPIIVFSLIVMGIIITMSVVSFTSFQNDFDLDSFNSTYESYVGTNSKTRVSYILDNVSTNNKKNKKHIITVKYKDTSTTNSDEIIDIKKNLSSDTHYEVKIDYDSKGYVYLITIE